MRSLRELARGSLPKIRPSMNRFVKIVVRASSLLLILTALQPAIFASVDDAQSFALQADRKSTRLNSSHSQISYAVFCLKKKTKPKIQYHSNYLTESDPK